MTSSDASDNGSVHEQSHNEHKAVDREILWELETSDASDVESVDESGSEAVANMPGGKT